MMKKIIIVSSILLIIFSTSPAAQNKTEADVLTIESAELFDANLAATEYLNMLTPEQKERSDAYFEGGYWILIWDFLIGAGIAWIFLSLGLSARIKRLALKAKRVNAQNLIYILIYLLIAFLISFPYSVYTGFIREHHYGLSNMTFAEWLSEEMISVVLLLALGSLFLMLLYMVMRKNIKNWWTIGSGVFILFLIFLLFIGPVFISPIFNNYKPLEDGPVKEEILSLARANGVPVDNIYQFDASKQSTRISANVSGIGSTIRVSLNDNLINNCTLPEIKSVMAHELGHYVLNHTYKLVIYLSLIVITGFAFVNIIMRILISRYGEKWGINKISDITSLPLFVLVFSLYILIANPFINNVIRTTESEADIFGLNSGREPDGFASVSMKLSEYRKINPGTLEEIIFFDHPSGKTRVLMAMKWKAENIH